MKVIGGYVSPYVRKVLACLHLKGLDYEIDPITPFFGDAEFERVSPLRRIPVLIDGDVELCDSSVICAYLDEAYPGHPLLPQAPADRARARWLEEYADTRMGDVFIWRLFQNAVIKPAVWGEKGDKAVIATALETDIPGVLDYLTTWRRRSRPRATCLANCWGWPTFRSASSSATPRSRASRSTSAAGRRRRRSWPACWVTRRFGCCSPMRTYA
jgi:glutathione S-transferase